MLMVVASLGCKRTMVGTEWANYHSGCMNRLRKCYSHLLGKFISGREGLLGSERRMMTIACSLMSGPT